MLTMKDLKQEIKDSLGLSDKSIVTEAYVTSAKMYDLATEKLSEKAKDAHDKLYKAYIEKLNKVSAQLDTIDRDNSSSASAYKSLKHDETFLRNAVHLHELYFSNISDVKSEVSYDSLSYMRLARDFGTFDDWQWDFIACAQAAKNGWAVTAYDTFLQRYVNFIVLGHDAHIPVGCYPVIVLDCWEHAFYRDYLDDSRKYIINMMRELNWNIIEKRIERADAIGKVLK